jgi:CRP-like cAMP-binding protein
MRADNWAEEFPVELRVGCRRAAFCKDDVVYNQATPAHTVYFLRRGKIKIEVAAECGKNAIVAILEPGSFFGEGCLIGEQDRRASAVALVQSEVLQVEKAAMLRLLRAEPNFAEFFWNRLLLRTRRAEEDLVDQMVNSTERRLARALLLLAHFDQEGEPRAITPRVSHETLSEIIGAARPRISQFMHKFREHGYISYEDGALRVHRSLFAVLQPEHRSTFAVPTTPASEIPSVHIDEVRATLRG